MTSPKDDYLVAAAAALRRLRVETPDASPAELWRRLEHAHGWTTEERESYGLQLRNVVDEMYRPAPEAKTPERAAVVLEPEPAKRAEVAVTAESSPADEV